VVFGLLCCVLMTAAALYSENRLRISISAQAWQQLYLAHFVCTTACGAGYLWLGWRQTGQVPNQGIMDLAVGLFLYALAFLAAGLLLVAGLVASWFALGPGMFLLYYGWMLCRGRTICAALDR
jgi:hypothetical protein